MEKRRRGYTQHKIRCSLISRSVKLEGNYLELRHTFMVSPPVINVTALVSVDERPLDPLGGGGGIRVGSVECGSLWGPANMT